MKPTTIHAYRQFVAAGIKYPGTLQDGDLVHLALELGAESGEVLALFQKAVRNGAKVPQERIVDELGDVLWAVQALLHQSTGQTLQALMDYNTAKLTARRAAEASNDE